MRDPVGFDVVVVAGSTATSDPSGHRFRCAGTEDGAGVFEIAAHALLVGKPR